MNIKNNTVDIKNSPLVSIDIISFNNVHYLHQSVKSVLSQTYNNIELVISDDASIECNIESLSLEICKAACEILLNNNIITSSNRIKDKWIHFSKSKKQKNNDFERDFEIWENKNRGNYYSKAIELITTNFKNIKSIKILKNKINKGTVKHLKTLKKDATGKYIMFLAADDMLHDDYVVSDMIQYFETLPDDSYVLTSQCGMYDVNLQNLLYYAVNDELKNIITRSSPKQLFAELTDWCIIPAAGTIYKKSVFEVYGDLDDRYHLIEDWTYFLKLTRSGAKIYFYDRLTYMHRDGGISHGNNTGGNVAYKYYLEDCLLLTKTEILPYLNDLPKRNRKRALKRYKDTCIEYTRKVRFSTMSTTEKIFFYLRNITRYAPKLFNKILEYNKNRAKYILNFSFFMVICSYLISLNLNKDSNTYMLYYLFGCTGLLLYLVSSLCLAMYYTAKAIKKIKRYIF